MLAKFYVTRALQVQLEHRATEQDSAEWEVDIDHTVTPQYNGSDTILIVATVTGTSFRQYAVETHTKYAKVICKLANSVL